MSLSCQFIFYPLSFIFYLLGSRARVIGPFFFRRVLVHPSLNVVLLPTCNVVRSYELNLSHFYLCGPVVVMYLGVDIQGPPIRTGVRLGPLDRETNHDQISDGANRNYKCRPPRQALVLAAEFEQACTGLIPSCAESSHALTSRTNFGGTHNIAHKLLQRCNLRLRTSVYRPCYQPTAHSGEYRDL
jgi:hypothetical protein